VGLATAIGGDLSSLQAEECSLPPATKHLYTASYGIIQPAMYLPLQSVFWPLSQEVSTCHQEILLLFLVLGQIPR
jgi:hypothetical protein